MKIRVLRNLGREWPQQFVEGSIEVLDREFGQALMDRGLAELVEADKPESVAESVDDSGIDEAVEKIKRVKKKATKKTEDDKTE